MTVPLVAFIILAAALAVFLERWKRGAAFRGVKAGMRQMMGTLPVIMLALLLAGMIEVLIPAEFVRDWLSAEAGMRGVFLGVIGGAMLAMGPYAAYPIIASVYSAGAGLGTAVALLTGWSLLGLSRIPYEVGFIGPGFAVRRSIVAFAYSLLAGAVAHLMSGLIL